MPVFPISLDIFLIKEWVELLSGIALLIGSLIAGLWAYIKFVVERGILPPIHFYIECNKIGEQKDKKILEVIIHLKNQGSSTLVASDLRVDLKYLKQADELEFLSNDVNNVGYGRLSLPNSLKEKFETSSEKSKGNRGFQVMAYDSFVQPGIDQAYSFVTSVPSSATFVLVWSRFQYAQRPSTLQRFLLNVSRKLGLIQYSLTHVFEPHTTERIFNIR
jgi:hypothetical protein